jgi:hypothetical protein
LGQREPLRQALATFDNLHGETGDNRVAMARVLSRSRGWFSERAAALTVHTQEADGALDDDR